MDKKYVEAVIFDLDGTLVDSKKDIIDSMNHVLRFMGIREKPDEVIQSYIGLGRDRLIADSMGHDATAQMIEACESHFKEYYRAHMFDHTVLYDSALDVLEYLKNKKLLIITNKNIDLTLATLEHFNISRYFEKVLGGDDAHCRKPDGCPINSLLDFVSADKKRSIIVGDSEIDVKAGRLAGIMTCALTSGIGSKERIVAEKPDFILDDIRKLKDIIC